MNSAEKLLDICADENINVQKVSTKQLNEFTESFVGGGIAFNMSNQKYILLDEQMEFFEKLLVLAHETAHHIFGHLDKDEVTKQMEDEARLFSVVYMALTIFNTREVEKK